MDVRQLYGALRQRKTVQTVVVYLGGSWGILQALSLFQQTYGWPRMVMDVALYLLACGLAAAVTISWYHGERGHQRVQRTELLILTLLGVAGVLGATSLARAPADPPPTGAGASATDSTIAVLPFVNRTGDASLTWLQGGLAEMLTTDLAQAPDLHLVSGERVYDLLQQQGVLRQTFVPESAALAVAARAGAGSLVRGFVFRQAGTMRVDAELVRVADGQVLASADAEGADVFPLVDSVALKLASKLLPGRALAAQAPLADVATSSLDAYREYSQGVAADRERREAEAASHYQRAVALDSTFPQALIRLGMSQFRAGQDSAAAATLRRAEVNLAQGPARQREFVQGILALLQGDVPAAEKKLQGLTRRYPEENDAWVWLARAYQATPAQRAAREAVLRQVLRLDPAYAPAYGDLALLHAREGDHGQADSLSARGVAAAPRDPQLLDARGEVLELAGRYADARTAYLTALRLRPDYTPVLAHLARAAERSGQLDSARADLAPFQRASDPAVRVQALLSAAELDLWQGRAAAAVAGQRQALAAAAPANAALRDQALLALAGSWGLLGEFDRVAEALAPRALVARGALLPYAAALGELGHLRALQALRDSVARRAPVAGGRAGGDPSAEELGAYMAFYGREWAAAAASFQAARARRGARGATLVDPREVLALLRAGRPADALALAGTADDPLALSALREHGRLYLTGRALEALGRGAEAAVAYRRIVADWGTSLARFPEYRDVPQRLARLGT